MNKNISTQYDENEYKYKKTKRKPPVNKIKKRPTTQKKRLMKLNTAEVER